MPLFLALGPPNVNMQYLGAAQASNHGITLPLRLLASCTTGHWKSGLVHVAYRTDRQHTSTEYTLRASSGLFLMCVGHMISRRKFKKLRENADSTRYIILQRFEHQQQFAIMLQLENVGQ